MFFPLRDENSTKFITTDNVSNYITPDVSDQTPIVLEDSDATLAINKRYFLKSNTDDRVITLPAVPSVGDYNSITVRLIGDVLNGKKYQFRSPTNWHVNSIAISGGTLTALGDPVHNHTSMPGYDLGGLTRNGFEIIGTTNGGGGLGTKIKFLAIGASWHMFYRGVLQGTGTAEADFSDFIAY